MTLGSIQSSPSWTPLKKKVSPVVTGRELVIAELHDSQAVPASIAKGKGCCSSATSEGP